MITYLEQQTWNNELFNHRQRTFSYDTNNNCSNASYWRWSWDDETWLPQNVDYGWYFEIYYNNMQNFCYFDVDGFHKINVSYIKVTKPNSVDDFYKSDIKIYPNPAKDKLFIECENFKSISIKIYDILGKEVLTQISDINTEINLSHLPQGIYTVFVFSDGKEIENSKIVKH